MIQVKRNILISVIILTLMLFVAILFPNNQKYLLPTEESNLLYLQNVENNIEKLNNILTAIQSREQADEAVYLIAKIVSLNRSAQGLLHYEELKTDASVQRLQYLLHTDNIRLSNRIYIDFFCEINRLCSQQFYHSESLKYMLHSFFVGVGENRLIPLWLPSARLRMTQNSKAEDDTLEGISEISINDSILKETINQNNDLTLEPIPLIVLNALQCAGERAAEDGFVTLITPPYHLIRGENLPFLDCFCPWYCIQKEQHSRTRKNRGIQWNHSSMDDILSLRKEVALKHTSRLAVKDTPYDSKIVFCLGAPFRSRYLIVKYSKNEQTPSSFIFSDDITEYCEELAK